MKRFFFLFVYGLKLNYNCLNPLKLMYPYGYLSQLQSYNIIFSLIDMNHFIIVLYSSHLQITLNMNILILTFIQDKS